MVQSVLWECAGKAAVIALTDGNGHFSLLSANGKLGRKSKNPFVCPFVFFYPSVDLYLQNSFILIDHFYACTSTYYFLQC